MDGTNECFAEEGKFDTNPHDNSALMALELEMYDRTCNLLMPASCPLWDHEASPRWWIRNSKTR